MSTTTGQVTQAATPAAKVLWQGSASQQMHLLLTLVSGTKVYLGGLNVSAANGTPLTAASPVVLRGAVGIVYFKGASGSEVVSWTATPATGNDPAVSINTTNGTITVSEPSDTQSAGASAQAAAADHRHGREAPASSVLHDGAISATSAFSTVEHQLASINFPAGTLKAKSKVRVTIAGTCTSGIGAGITFSLYAGTTGAFATDSMFLQWEPDATGEGSSQSFKAVIDLIIYTAGASGLARGSLGVESVQAGTGIGSTAVNADGSGYIDTDTATYLEATMVSTSTGTTLTIQTCDIEVLP